jgi:hypothetical protein
VPLPDHAHVDEENVVFTQHRIAIGTFLEGLQGVGAKADQQRMPDAVHAQSGENLLARSWASDSRIPGLITWAMASTACQVRLLGVTHGFQHKTLTDCFFPARPGHR